VRQEAKAQHSGEAMTIGAEVTYHGKKYTVIGYATEGQRVFAVWLEGIAEVIKGKMLGSVDF
jgi:hypothetical protein